MRIRDSSSGVQVAGASAESLADYLCARNINVEVEQFENEKNIATELLERCDAANVDSMIMGAYSNSHEAETILGGTTKDIVDNAEIPVIMVH